MKDDENHKGGSQHPSTIQYPKLVGLLLTPFGYDAQHVWGEPSNLCLGLMRAWQEGNPLSKPPRGLIHRSTWVKAFMRFAMGETVTGAPFLWIGMLEPRVLVIRTSWRGVFVLMG